MHKFSDFAKDEVHLDGAKRPFETLVDQNIVIWAAKEMQSQYEDSDTCVMIQFSLTEDGERFVTFTGSKVIAQQISEYKENMPFETVITKRQSKKHYFYTLT